MNAIALPLPLIPENAPFSTEQRAWLNGFLAGLYGGGNSGGIATPPLAAEPEEDFPWHDPALELNERLRLAEGQPLKRKLMAAMAQLDCGQCGYLCQTYSEALADGRETTTTLCVPGARSTARTVKQLLAAAPAPAAAVAQLAATAQAEPAKPIGVPVRVIAADPLTSAGSAKDVRHVVIDLAGSGLSYLPGDSINIAVRSDPALIEATIAALGATGQELVPCADGQTRPLRQAFAVSDIARPLDRTFDLLAMAATYPAHADWSTATTGPNPIAPTYWTCCGPFHPPARHWPTLSARCPCCVRGCTPSPRRHGHTPARCIFASASCGTPGAAGFGTASAAASSAVTPAAPAPSSPASRRAISACPPTRPRRSSWSGQEPGSRRSAPSWRSATPPACAGAPGCSSATSTANPISSMGRSCGAGSPTARWGGSTSPSHATRTRRSTCRTA